MNDRIAFVAAVAMACAIVGFAVSRGTAASTGAVPMKETASGAPLARIRADYPNDAGFCFEQVGGALKCLEVRALRTLADKDGVSLEDFLKRKKAEADAVLKPGERYGVAGSTDGKTWELVTLPPDFDGTNLEQAKAAADRIAATAGIQTRVVKRKAD